MAKILMYGTAPYTFLNTFNALTIKTNYNEEQSIKNETITGKLW